jgi:hypothetical protein
MPRLAADLAWTLGTLGAAVQLWSRWLGWNVSKQTPEERQRRREWHEVKWNQVKNSGWFQIPERVIRWLIHGRNSLSEVEAISFIIVAIPLFPFAAIFILWSRADQFSAAHVPQKVALFLGAVLLYFAGILSQWRGQGRRGIALMVCLIALAMGFYVLYRPDSDHLRAVLGFLALALAVFRFSSGDQKISWLVLVPLGIVSLEVWRQWFDLVCAAPIGWALFYALLGWPLIGTVTASLLGGPVYVYMRLFKKFTEETMKRVDYTVILFGASVGLSFFFTILTMFIGRELSPQSLVPQTKRMLWSNALFDGATVVASLYVLERAIPPLKRFNIFLAVLLNLVLGTLFAWGSLWFGIKGLLLKEALWVFVGHSLDGTHWELGPYFWTMHSTFLPLLFYLVAILFCWTAKMFLSYRMWFHQRAKELDGLAMTSNFLGLVGGSIAFVGVMLGGAILFKLIP